MRQSLHDSVTIFFVLDQFILCRPAQKGAGIIAVFLQYPVELAFDKIDHVRPRVTPDFADIVSFTVVIEPRIINGYIIIKEFITALVLIYILFRNQKRLYFVNAKSYTIMKEQFSYNVIRCQNQACGHRLLIGYIVKFTELALIIDAQLPSLVHVIVLQKPFNE